MTTPLRRLADGCVLSLLAACLGADSSPEAAAPPPVRHVFVIVLENRNYDSTFGPASPAPYLADSMVRAGALLRQYYGIGHSSLDNYVAMISGIAPNRSTQADCPVFTEFTETGMAADGQPVGLGCVYPPHVPTIANQLAETGRHWRAYLEDMGNNPDREPAVCAHPSIGAVDHTERADNADHDRYATKHNPFVYFHAIIDSASCAHDVVPLTALPADLAANPPAFSFIVPNLCNDAHDPSCGDAPGGLPAADQFLRHWVPLITQSPAFKDGLLLVIFDEAGDDSRACCSEPSGPNTSIPGGYGPGGGRTGAVALSPFIAPGTVTDVPYNHYSMLKSVEEFFGLSYLGYAGRAGLAGFGPDVFTRR